MKRFKSKRLTRVGSSLGFRGYEVATLYTPDKDMNNAIRSALISAEAVDLVRAALTKFKRIEMSHADFISEVGNILLEYDELSLEP